MIGDSVTIKPGVQLWDGLRIGNHVFIGPNVTFTNDLAPRSKRYPDKFLVTTVEDGASLGANSTILAGVTIGKYAMIGAGSVVTKNIPAFTLWFGNPAEHKGYITQNATILDFELKDRQGKKYKMAAGEPRLDD